MRSQRRVFQAQLISGQISSNVSTEHPLIWLSFQTFDKREKEFQKDIVMLQLSEDVPGSLPLMLGGGGVIFLPGNAALHTCNMCCFKKAKKKK